MAIGNRIWDDSSGVEANENNGQFDDDESGIDGVTIQVYQDDGDGTFELLEDTFITETVSAGGGYYLIDNLLPGNYFVHVPAAEFQNGGDLFETLSSDGAGGDNATDEASDENGVDDLLAASNGITSNLIQLTRSAETLSEAGSPALYADSNTDMTVDFSFRGLDPTVVGLNSAETTNLTHNHFLAVYLLLLIGTCLGAMHTRRQ